MVSGLLSDLPRKNCWTLAEHAGDATPDGMQHLLHRAKWDAAAIRDDIRAYVVEHLRDIEAVLVVDETGDLKKGTATVGVQRQYAGTASRVENAQVAVHLVYSAARAHAAIDRALYVPRSWTEAPDRCRSAGIPDGLAFATKPQLAALRTALAHRRTGYVLAVSSTHSVITPAGKLQAKTLAARIPKRAWQRLSAGAGAKGERYERYYGWTQIDIHDAASWPGQWCLLARRNRRTGELAFYRCFSPRPVRCRCPSWCGWPDGAGRSRRRSRQART